MPWSKAQNKLFRAAEHDPKIAKSAGIKQEDAARMAHEGIKGETKKKSRPERLYKK